MLCESVLLVLVVCFPRAGATAARTFTTCGAVRRLRSLSYALADGEARARVRRAEVTVRRPAAGMRGARVVREWRGELAPRRARAFAYLARVPSGTSADDRSKLSLRSIAPPRGAYDLDGAARPLCVRADRRRAFAVVFA